MYKYILIVLLLVGLVGYTIPSIAEPTTVSVMFINGNPGVAMLGLVRFTVDESGNKIHKLMNMKWADAVKIIPLEPGVYGITQYVPIYNKIVAYQTFTVSKKPITIEFRRL